jgi:hypothetical protein
MESDNYICPFCVQCTGYDMCEQQSLANSIYVTNAGGLHVEVFVACVRLWEHKTQYMYYVIQVYCTYTQVR